MNKIPSEYYSHQGSCRGINTVEDVQRAVRRSGAVYERLLGGYLPSDGSVPIYEAACGPGILMTWLKGKGFREIRGSDIAEKEVLLARQTGFEVAHGNSIDDLEKFTGGFQFIFAFDFIEHLPREEALRFLRAAHRALKPGGLLVLRMPNGDSPFVGRNFFNDITHQWAYTTTAFRAVATICGYGKVWYRDDTLISISRWRLVKLPFMWVAQLLVKGIFRMATHENFQYLGSSIYCFAKKIGE
jgi:2-polyprenyl-3-methyl-5-hydroxy-6-metoxy-1,4-benzoquinol methylase